MRYSATALTLLATFPFASAGARHHGPDTCPSTLHFPLQTCPIGYHNNVPPPPPSQQAEEELIDHSNTWNETGLCVQSYCLYTNPSFANNGGISIITTPPNLALFKSLTSSPLPSSQNSHPPSPPPYAISPIPEKGLGLLATTPLPRGTPIMSHTPTLLIHRTFLESLAPHANQPLLDAAASSLPPTTRSLFLSQMGHHGGHKVTDILATNSFQTNLGGSTDGHHYGNYPAVSRFNHDCRPNVAFYIDSRLNHRTTTVREVARGEELTISYLDSFAPRKERQQRAVGAWGFRCGCAQCSLSEREGEKSDRRLEEIARLRGVLEDVESKGVDGRMVRRYVKLWRDERLDFAMAGAWTVVALNWNMLGEEEMARKYARLAVEAGEIEFGEDGAGDVREMRELERWPKRHVSWRRRVDKTGS